VRAKLEAATGRLSISGRLTEEQAALLFVGLTYLAFWLPWAIQPRIMFIYHYLPAVPFLILALAYLVHWLWQRVVSREFLPGLLLLAGGAAATFLSYILDAPVGAYYALWPPMIAGGALFMTGLMRSEPAPESAGAGEAALSGRIAAMAMLAIAGLTFVYFYPHYAAVSVVDWLGDSYFWFASWH
jgi:dolichyl-phosphate-mannose--protein O-mannosyl transferase